MCKHKEISPLPGETVKGGDDSAIKSVAWFWRSFHSPYQQQRL